jgi:hypothetical protein
MPGQTSSDLSPMGVEPTPEWAADLERRPAASFMIAARGCINGNPDGAFWGVPAVAPIDADAPAVFVQRETRSCAVRCRTQAQQDYDLKVPAIIGSVETRDAFMEFCLCFLFSEIRFSRIAGSASRLIRQWLRSRR